MKKPEIIFIASDHAGFTLKQFLMDKNPDQNWKDLGIFNADKTSQYPDQAVLLCRNMKSQNTSETHMESKDIPKQFGVLICGSGQGMAIQANRFPGIRAACVWDEESCRLSREHNNANVLCLGARLTPFEKSLKIFKTFINTTFEGGRHIERVKKIDSLA